MKKHLFKFPSLLILSFIISCSPKELPEKYGQADTKLYLGKGTNQPLIVGLGGSEGGNMWASDYWKNTREQFIENGFAFLALEYFGGSKTPQQLDRISIDSIHSTITKIAQHEQIDENKIILIGGSKGAELALLMASKFPTIKGVVSIVGPHATFPALTFMANTSSWTHLNTEIAFVPLPWSATGAALKNDLREAFTIMLKDSVAVENAAIKVEAINGPILLMSATKDEMWPSTEMSDQLITRLKQNNFPHSYKHIAIEGDHRAPLAHFDSVLHFLNKHYQ